jgi:hypothetical protein
MTALSSAAWVVHDVGLAAAIGGPLFEYTAMAPALERSRTLAERDRISIDAANRFSWVKLLSHASFAIPWIFGRTMRSGCEVSARARSLTKVKDILVGVSLFSGLAGLAGLKRARDRVERGEGAAHEMIEREHPMPTKSPAMATLGIVNVLANVGILGITALLAMQAGKSIRFAASSRRLP